MGFVILSLGGSVIVPDQINIELLKEFRQLILDFVKKGNKVAIICGGGNTNKVYNTAAQEITEIKDLDLDWIGIKATKLNAEFVRSLFGEEAYGVINNPEDKIDTDKNILIGAGYEPGCSSDMDAVLLAINLGAKKIINMSNIDYAYDKDPREHDDAKPIEETSWDEFFKVVGDTWKPRLNAPFDPIASKKAKEAGLEVDILNGNKLDNLMNCLEDKEFVGTKIR